MSYLIHWIDKDNIEKTSPTFYEGDETDNIIHFKKHRRGKLKKIISVEPINFTKEVSGK